MKSYLPVQGSLFPEDFLAGSIAQTPDWLLSGLPDAEQLAASLTSVFDRFPIGQRPNEGQTECDLVRPILEILGWTASLAQQNLSARGRQDVPDILLFADSDWKERANAVPEEWKRYAMGSAIIEVKRWQRPLDRRSGWSDEVTAPATQMLRYLRRVDDPTGGRLRWGILTNGRRWRLYWQGARSVAEQFFEIDLAAVLGIPSAAGDAIAPEERGHWLRVFALVFRREAFLPGPLDRRTFHQRAIDEGRHYEERVAASLAALVFEGVFPELARALANARPDAPLKEVRNATLILLYRLLFIFYAEDRNLLPVRDPRYAPYALRGKVREDVGTRKDRNDIFSETAACSDATALPSWTGLRSGTAS